MCQALDRCGTEAGVDVRAHHGGCRGMAAAGDVVDEHEVLGALAITSGLGGTGLQGELPIAICLVPQGIERLDEEVVVTGSIDGGVECAMGGQMLGGGSGGQRFETLVGCANGLQVRTRAALGGQLGGQRVK